MSDQTNRFSELIINPESVRYIANQISQRIQRKLSGPEIDDLFAFIRRHQTQAWNNYRPIDIRNTLVQNYLQLRFTNDGRKANKQDDLVDIHEILKTVIGTASVDAAPEVVDNVDVDGNPVNSDTQAISFAQGGLITNPGAAGAAKAVPASLGSLDNVATINKIMQVVSVTNLAGIFGTSDKVSFQQIVNPQAAYVKNYIILDSRWRDTSADIPGQGVSIFVWNFLQNSVINTAGAVNSLGNVQNIVKIMSSNIRIPIPNASNALQINTYNRVSLLINEFNSQSYVAQEGRRYHFMYESSEDGNQLNCHALPLESATFEFAKPITQLDSFTVTFGNPLEVLTFDMDRLNMAVGYTNPATLTSTLPHNLQTGDQIYITGFTTNDTQADATIIASVNRQNGWNVFVTSATQVQVEGLDLTTVTAPITPYSVPVYFGSKRIFVPLELQYINQPNP